MSGLRRRSLVLLGGGGRGKGKGTAISAISISYICSIQTLSSTAESASFFE